jgi:hypothetical protein
MEAGVRVVSLPRLRSLFFFRQGVTESLYQISRAYLLVIPPILTKTLTVEGKGCWRQVRGLLSHSEFVGRAMPIA